MKIWKREAKQVIAMGRILVEKTDQNALDNNIESLINMSMIFLKKTAKLAENLPMDLDQFKLSDDKEIMKIRENLKEVADSIEMLIKKYKRN